MAEMLRRVFARSSSTSRDSSSRRKHRKPCMEVVAERASDFHKANKFEKSEQGEPSPCLNFRYGAAARQGFRPEMQDDYLCASHFELNGSTYSFFAVFDGHGEHGGVVSHFCSDYFLDCMLERKALREIKPDDKTEEVLVSSVRKSFMKFDEEIRSEQRVDENFDYSGTTASTVIISHDTILWANTGDSRGVLCRDGRVHFATSDHNPCDEKEAQRIEASGGSVYTTPSRYKVILDPERRNNLAVSRTFGDFAYKFPAKLPPEKQMVTPNPDITITPRNTDKDEFLLLASDGVYKAMSSEEVVSFVRQRLELTDDLTKVCLDLITACYYAPGNIPDDTTVVLLTFPAAPKVSQQAIAQDRLLTAEALTEIEKEIKSLVDSAETCHYLDEFSVIQRLGRKLPAKYRVALRVQHISEVLAKLCDEKFSQMEEEVPSTSEPVPEQPTSNNNAAMHSPSSSTSQIVSDNAAMPLDVARQPTTANLVGRKVVANEETEKSTAPSSTTTTT